jgi:TPR repeat protein
MSLYAGDGVAQNYNEAVRWCTLSAAQGFAKAQFGLGLMHFEGNALPRDYTEAARWFKLAADQGEPNAIGYLAEVLMHLYPDGTRVELAGLKSVRFNGKRGVVARQGGNAFAVGRVSVLVDGDSIPKAFAFENLVELQG